MKDLGLVAFFTFLWFVLGPESMGEAMQRVSCGYHGTCEPAE
jgi:hypothetical protein